MIWAYDALREKPVLHIVSLVVLFVLSVLVNSSHTYTGVVLILLMYILCDNKAPLIVIGAALQPRHDSPIALYSDIFRCCYTMESVDLSKRNLLSTSFTHSTSHIFYCCTL